MSGKPKLRDAVKIAVYIPRAQRAKLDEIYNRLGVPISVTVRKALEFYFSKKANP
jgi:Ribbon-helix-helix domain